MRRNVQVFVAFIRSGTLKLLQLQLLCKSLFCLKGVAEFSFTYQLHAFQLIEKYYVKHRRSDAFISRHNEACGIGTIPEQSVH